MKEFKASTKRGQHLIAMGKDVAGLVYTIYTLHGHNPKNVHITIVMMNI